MAKQDTHIISPTSIWILEKNNRSWIKNLGGRNQQQNYVKKSCIAYDRMQFD